ncbi:MAG: N-acyl homoserine lactonase family protein [Chloroflexi bacterium]|nr:N-acyl homoserine lactonase family protein [Chloroflexota bacterium]
MKIHAIQTGTVAIKKNQLIGKGAGARRLVNVLFGREWVQPPVPIYAWVIEHEEGVIVVDTGETARTSEVGYFPRWHPYYNLAVRFQVKPEQEIGAQLKQMGIYSKDVTKVILTHMHTDHAGRLHDFPDSAIHVNMPEYKRTHGFRGQIDGYLSHRFPNWFSPQPIEFDGGAFGAFDKSWNVTAKGDVKVVPTPGHTPAHVSVIVTSEDVHYFLAGDTSYTEENLLRKIPDGVSPNPNQAVDTMQHILSFAKQRLTIYLPSHDPNSELRLKNKATLSFSE